MTTDGKPYGPIRYKAICREMYLIAKNSGIPLDDIKRMTPLERNYFYEFVEDDAKRLKEQYDKITNTRNQ